MADWYVDSNAVGANNGTTKADAYLDWELAFAGSVTDGDRVLTSHTHAKSWTATQVYTSPTTTSASQVYVISIDFSDDSVTAGAEENQTGAAGGDDIGFGANSGIIFIGCTIRSNDNLYINNDGNMTFIDCILDYANLGLGSNDVICTIDGCTLRPETATSGIAIGGGNRVTIIKSTLSSARATPTALFTTVSQPGGSTCILRGNDFSAGASGFELFKNPPANPSDGQSTLLSVQGNVMPSSSSYIPSLNEHGTRLEAYDNAIGTSAVPGINVQDFRGLTTEDTTVYRDADYDGVNGYSYKSTATVNGKPGVLPHRVKIWEQGLTAADPTLTVQLLTDGAVTFNAADVWIEFEHPTVGSAGTSIISTVDPDFGLGTPAALSAGVGAGAWTNPPAGSTSYQIQQAITGGRAGVHRAYLNFAPGVAEAIYSDPSVDVT